MTTQLSRIAFRKALEKSLDLLGEPSKKSLLLYLERDFGISLSHHSAADAQPVEAALKSIFGQGAYIITDEINKNLKTQSARARKRLVASKQSSRSA